MQAGSTSQTYPLAGVPIYVSSACLSTAPRYVWICVLFCFIFEYIYYYTYVAYSSIYLIVYLFVHFLFFIYLSTYILFSLLMCVTLFEQNHASMCNYIIYLSTYIYYFLYWCVLRCLSKIMRVCVIIRSCRVHIYTCVRALCVCVRERVRVCV